MALAKQFKNTCIVISPQHPSLNGGYGIALKSSLIKYNSIYNNVYYIVISDTQPDKNISTSVNRYIMLKPNNRPIIYRYLSSLFKGMPAVCVRYVSPKIKKNILKEVKHIVDSHKSENIDIFLEDVPLGQYAKFLKKALGSKVHLILRSHNVIGEIFEGIEKGKPFWLRKMIQIENARMARFENNISREVDCLLAITERDKAEYYKRYGISCNGVLGVYLPDELEIRDERANILNIIHVGSVDMRKQVGLKIFLDEEWPKVLNANSDAKMILAGKNTEKFDNPKLGIYGMGYVDNIDDIINKGQIFINPQIIGSGIKIKSLLALKCEKTLVTTKKGCEGINIRSNKECIITNSVNGMGDIIAQLLNDRKFALEIAKKGREHLEKEFSMRNLLECDIIV